MCICVCGFFSFIPWYGGKYDKKNVTWQSWQKCLCTKRCVLYERTKDFSLLGFQCVRFKVSEQKKAEHGQPCGNGVSPQGSK